MKRFSSLIALVGFLTVAGVSTLSFANDPAPDDQKDKKETTAPKVVMSDEKKEDKKDKGGNVVFSDDKKDEKKGMGGK